MYCEIDLLDSGDDLLPLLWTERKYVSHTVELKNCEGEHVYTWKKFTVHLEDRRFELDTENVCNEETLLFMVTEKDFVMKLDKKKTLEEELKELPDA